MIRSKHSPPRLAGQFTRALDVPFGLHRAILLSLGLSLGFLGCDSRTGDPIGQSQESMLIPVEEELFVDGGDSLDGSLADATPTEDGMPSLDAIPVGDAGWDATPQDAMVVLDATVLDATVDAMVVLDATVLDATVDAMTPDASPDASVVVDAGVPDASPDASPDAGCENCVCNGDWIPETEFAVSVEVGKFAKLPFVNKRIGGSIKVNASVAGEPADCHNDCTGKLDTTLGGAIEMEAGTEKLTVGLNGQWNVENKYCKECNEETCEYECTELSCEKDGWSITGNATYEKYLGIPKINKKLGPVELQFECGVTGSIPAGGTFSSSREKPGTCNPCQDCETWGGSGTLGLAATASCNLYMFFWGKGFALGCQECANVYANSTLGVNFKDGDCGDQTCVSLNGKIGAKVSTGQQCMGWGWFRVGVNCGARVEGRANTDSCGTSEYDGDLNGWCTVKYRPNPRDCNQFVRD